MEKPRDKLPFDRLGRTQVDKRASPRLAQRRVIPPERLRATKYPLPGHKEHLYTRTFIRRMFHSLERWGTLGQFANRLAIYVILTRVRKQKNLILLGFTEQVEEF